MTKRHFDYAASMVRAMLAGQWTNEPPSWADGGRIFGPFVIGPIEDDDDTENDWRYTRAVWTAEAFVMLFRNHNPLFDESRFLQACGLVAKTERKRVAKKGAQL